MSRGPASWFAASRWHSRGQRRHARHLVVMNLRVTSSCDMTPIGGGSRPTRSSVAFTSRRQAFRFTAQPPYRASQTDNRSRSQSRICAVTSGETGNCEMPTTDCALSSFKSFAMAPKYTRRPRRSLDSRCASTSRFTAWKSTSNSSEPPTRLALGCMHTPPTQHHVPHAEAWTTGRPAPTRGGTHIGECAVRMCHMLGRAG